MHSLYNKGELLQVYAKTSEVNRDHFYSISNDTSMISLNNVKEYSKGEENQPIHHYNDFEVGEIVKLQKPKEKNYLNLTQKEIDNFIELSKKYVYINQVDKSFYEAIEDLNQYKYIALGIDGANMGRKCKMPFLVLSTPQQIYIFDTQVMQYNAFDAGLKNLLESGTPKKIIHDCRKISDCLYHKHNVKINSIFDTQVGDLIITKNKRGRLPTTVKSLAECLNTYLGLSSNIIEEKLDIVQCTTRPLPANVKENLAKNIAYHHHLSKCINKEMMLPFYRGIEWYIENMRSCDDFKAWELSGKSGQLPKDFASAIEY